MQSSAYTLACWLLPKEPPQADGECPLLGGEDAKVHVHADPVEGQAHIEAIVVVEVCQDAAECAAVVALDGEGEALRGRCLDRDGTSQRDVARAARPVSAGSCQFW